MILPSVNVREDIWHFFYVLRLTQKAVRVIMQCLTINYKGTKKNALREPISVFSLQFCMTETVQPISGTLQKENRYGLRRQQRPIDLN